MRYFSTRRPASKLCIILTQLSKLYENSKYFELCEKYIQFQQFVKHSVKHIRPDTHTHIARQTFIVRQFWLAISLDNSSEIVFVRKKDRGQLLTPRILSFRFTCDIFNVKFCFPNHCPNVINLFLVFVDDI